MSLFPATFSHLNVSKGTRQDDGLSIICLIHGTHHDISVIASTQKINPIYFFCSLFCPTSTVLVRHFVDEILYISSALRMSFNRVVVFELFGSLLFLLFLKSSLYALNYAVLQQRNDGRYP